MLMNTPENLKYSKEHEWVRIEGDVAYIGVTDYAQDQLGDIVYVDVESLDEEVEKDAIFGSIEAVKTVSDLFSPLSGTVTELNEALEDNPELVNSDPYGEGWIIKLTFTDASELDSLLSPEAYTQFVEGGE